MKKAEASLDHLRRVFTVPEGDDSTLAAIEKEISRNLTGFLRDHIVSEERAPSKLERDFMDSIIPEEPRFVSDQASFLLDKVVAQSVHTASPAFIGHMTSAIPYFMLPLAKIMFALNQNTVKIETSKAFTPLESQVIGMLHRLVYGHGDSPSCDDDFYRNWIQNRDHALGVFCSGGTIANLTALWVARNRLLAPCGDFAGISEDGMIAGLRAWNYDDVAVLVSKRGHYSLKKSCDVLGLGKKNLVVVETTGHKIDLADLQKKIDWLRSRRIGIAAIVGIAGTTETGNVDPLMAMADIASRHKIHFHVDGAWGGPTLFSSRYRALLAGIERADSVTIDAHKQLYVPVGSGMVLFKDPLALDSIQHSAQYIIRKGSRDLGKHTLEGSRPGMALLVHSGLHVLGRKGYEMLIDLGIGKAGQFAKMIQANPHFELTTAPELNLLTYRFLPSIARETLAKAKPPEGQRINDCLSELTEQMQKTQRSRGKTFVSRTRFEIPQHHNQACTVFRVVLANPLTTRHILADILEEQRNIGEQLMTGSLGDKLKAACAAVDLMESSPSNPGSKQ
jgi:glutamate decarboxylase